MEGAVHLPVGEPQAQEGAEAASGTETTPHPGLVGAASTQPGSPPYLPYPLPSTQTEAEEPSYYYNEFGEDIELERWRSRQVGFGEGPTAASGPSEIRDSKVLKRTNPEPDSPESVLFPRGFKSPRRSSSNNPWFRKYNSRTME
jgi:hypothetical protein